jgi:hypothetical protein
VNSDARVVSVAVKWPGATNDITCFRNMRLFDMLCDGLFPSYVNIVADEAYAGVCKECRNQILTPYSRLQFFCRFIKGQRKYTELGKSSGIRSIV